MYQEKPICYTKPKQSWRTLRAEWVYNDNMCSLFKCLWECFTLVCKSRLKCKCRNHILPVLSELMEQTVRFLVSKKSCCDRFVLSELTRKLRLCWICLKPYMPTCFECCFYSNPESNHRLPLNERQSIIDQSNVLLITTWSEHLMVPNGLGFQHKRISFFIKKNSLKKQHCVGSCNMINYTFFCFRSLTEQRRGG